MVLTAPGLPARSGLCFCTTCGQLFNSESMFDAHRKGQYPPRGTGVRCLSIAEMTAKGWLQNARGAWIRAEYAGPGTQADAA